MALPRFEKVAVPAFIGVVMMVELMLLID